MIKQAIGIGTGVAAVAVAGAIGYRYYVQNGAAPAAAAPTPPPSRVITLGKEAPATAESGKVLISPVTPKQMLPKTSDLKPRQTAATQPASAQPGPTQGFGAQPSSATPAMPAPAKLSQPSQTKTTTQPVQTRSAQPKKSRVISIQGDGHAAGSADAGTTPAGGRLTPQEKTALSMIHELRSLRSSIDMWRVRHQGQVPDFVAGPMWEQLVRRDAAGQILDRTPVNPLNGQSRVLPVRQDPKPGEPVNGPFGFVYAVASGKLFATDSMGRVFDDAAVDAVALESRAVRELAPKDQERYLLAALDAVRSQLFAYAEQHNDRLPDFATYPSFEQMMKPTLADGRIVEGGGQGFGPYVLSMPVNALNGNYKVATVQAELRPGQRIDSSGAGFVFSVSTRRLFALDASGCVFDDAKARAAYIPTESGGTGGSSASTAGASPAELLRTGLAVYRQQHNGALPDFRRYPHWEQLTSKTNADGKPDPAGQFGPYLFNTPVNSRNNSSEVEVVQRLPKGYKPKKSVGYVFDLSTGNIVLTDESGNVIAEQ